MPLEIVGAGFGRTGTKSLKTALEQLGYVKCHHMSEVIPNPRQIAYWSRASKGEPVDWDEVFNGFNAAVDWPSAAYWKELAGYYPDAKVILSVRDPEAWYTSVRETIYRVADAIPGWVCLLYPPMGTFRAMVPRTIWQGIFDGRFEDREYALRVFRDHIEEVKRTIPPDRLLVHEAKEGWGPLCAFLGKPVPEFPYPRVNEASQIKRMITFLTWLGRAPWILAAIAAVSALIAFAR
jgi:hypothetical protein